MEGLTKALLNKALLNKALLNKALLNYNNELQKTPINHLQHDTIVTAYKKVISAYNNLIDSITRLQQEKESFEQNHDSIMRTILDKNPNLLDFSTSSIKSTKRQTKTIGGYRTPSKRKTKRKRP